MPKTLRLLVVLTATLTAGLAAQAQAPPDSKDRPFYYTREIAPSDLDGRTLRELSLMRNTIYARAGNKFRRKWLNDYFSAQSWYHPLEKMDTTKLSRVDLRNAEVIANYDASLSRKDLLALRKAVIDPKSDEGKVELHLISVRLGQWQ